MGIKKQLSLRIVFLEYLIVMAFVLSLTLILLIGLFSLGNYFGLYTNANLAEIQAKKIETELRSSKSFDASIIPTSIHYVFISSNDMINETNMGQDELQNAKSYQIGQFKPASLDDCYMVITRDDGICVLHYYIRSMYQIEWLNQHFLSPDIFILVMMVVFCMISCLSTTAIFARHLKRQLQPLMEATLKIKEQNLDFEVRFSRVKEFNEILISINDMKSELKQSMEQQWKLEASKKEQTSALAHDIKTPLTIIRGNSELLMETALTEEQREYTNFIMKNQDRMEQYLNMLISLTKNSTDYPVHICEIKMQPFLEELLEQARGLALSKHIKIKITTKNLPINFRADKELLHRALLNVVSNAIDYSPEPGIIHITVELRSNCSIDVVRFIITDCGNGFSALDLKQALSQFYMGDTSRSQNNHYGIGLYITNSIVKQHHGTLLIANSESTSGGEVIIELPA